MKILAMTDVHGAYDLAEKIINKELPDILIIGGDLTTVGTVKEVEGVITRFRTMNNRILCIAGNMDLPQHDDLYIKFGVSLNARGVSYDNIGFAGVSASPISPLHTPYEISESEISKRLISGFKQIARAKIKIIVSHTPPFGTKVDITHSGIHVGSMALREFIEETKPEVVICGHIHEARGQDEIEKSKIVNCGKASNGYYTIIDIEGDMIEIKNLQYHNYS